jgi:DnaJ-class molecular chaperone
MTIKKQKNRNYDLVEDDRWKRKGVVYTGKENLPKICVVCLGTGKDSDGDECPICAGEGVIYD